MLSASGGFAPRPPPGLCPWTPLGDFRLPDPLILPPPGKNPAGAHACEMSLSVIKATIKNKTTSVTTHKKLTTGNNVFIVSVIV